MNTPRCIFTSILIVTITLGCSKDENLSDFPDSANKAVGTSAKDLLTASPYNSLRIQFAHPQNAAPSSTLVNDFKTFLENRLHKPGGVNIVLFPIDIPAKSAYSATEIRALESQYRTAFSSGNQFAVWAFYADASYAENDDVLGIAYRNSSLALFAGRIREATGGIGQPNEQVVMSTVLHHEMGHILGLVNIGTPMDSSHEDPDHSGHCDNSDCLMYWSVNSSAGLADLLGLTSPPDPDTQCIADLQAFGGK